MSVGGEGTFHGAGEVDQKEDLGVATSALCLGKVLLSHRKDASSSAGSSPHT